MDILDRLDPSRIFSTKLLDRLMPRTPDLTGDGVVDTADLSDMLTSWGPGSPPADLIINQEVGGEDMGQLLMHWGPLPL